MNLPTAIQALRDLASAEAELTADAPPEDPRWQRYERAHETAREVLTEAMRRGFARTFASALLVASEGQIGDLADLLEQLSRERQRSLVELQTLLHEPTDDEGSGT